MKVSIGISNYNYGKFVLECVESALDQTYSEIEIIVVDDGSTDDSISLLKTHYGDNEKVMIVDKENGGQLSTFNVLVEHANGDIVFFLDADDLYEKNYVEEIVKIYKAHTSVDFVFCAFNRFYEDGKDVLIKQYEQSITIGFNVIAALYAQEWVGGPTSTISMKMDVFKRICPIPFEESWKSRADDCLVWGASVFGAKKYFCSDALVRYRVHDENGYHGKKFDEDYLYRRELKISSLLGFFKSRIYSGDAILNTIHFEYGLRNDKSKNLLKKYMKIIGYSSLGLMKKIKLYVRLLQYHYRG